MMVLPARPVVFACAIALGAGACSTLSAKPKPDPYEERIGQLEKRLSEAMTGRGDKGSVLDADMAVRALGKIAMFNAARAKDPGNKDIPAMFSSCSLLVEAAVVEMQLGDTRAQATFLQSKTTATLNELNTLHEEINKFERSNAAQLKADLDAEKAKAEKLREEAERRFNDLQSELISVKRDARGTIISMSDILFDVNKANLTANLETSLAKIAGVLTVFKDSKIIVEGHTDNQGGEEYNQKLSEQRAENVMNFLVEQGVAASRLTSIGYGFTRPVADNSTKEGRQKNRRVDLVIQDTAQQKQAQEGEW